MDRVGAVSGQRQRVAPRAGAPAGAEHRRLEGLGGAVERAAAPPLARALPDREGHRRDAARVACGAADPGTPGASVPPGGRAQRAAVDRERDRRRRRGRVHRPRVGRVVAGLAAGDRAHLEGVPARSQRAGVADARRGTGGERRAVELALEARAARRRAVAELRRRLVRRVAGPGRDRRGRRLRWRARGERDGGGERRDERGQQRQRVAPERTRRAGEASRCVVCALVALHLVRGSRCRIRVEERDGGGPGRILPRGLLPSWTVPA